MLSTFDKDNLLISEPLVSIIVITYNSIKYVLETLESAKAQTYPNIELIVSDDCSTDNTVEISEKWINENKNRFVKTQLITVKKNTGIPANCNRGVQASSGTWIKLIAGDDMLLENCIQDNVQFIHSNPLAKIVQSNSNTYNKEFTISSFKEEEYRSGSEIHPPLFSIKWLKIRLKINRINLLGNGYIKSDLREIFIDNKINAKEQYRILLRYNMVNAPTVFTNKSLLNEFNGFDESIPFVEDLPMWLRITKTGIKIHFLNSTTVNYRLHDNSITGEHIINTIFNRYHLKLRDVYIKYIFPDIPAIERFFINYEYYRLKRLEKLGLNKSKPIYKLIHLLTYIPTYVCEKLVLKSLLKALNNR